MVLTVESTYETHRERERERERESERKWVGNITVKEAFITKQEIEILY